MRVFQLKRSSLLLIALIFTLITISLAVYPEAGLSAAKAGLQVFWEIVFPSLLPFFVLSEILLGLGVVNAFGVFLEPLMRPVFNVPGVGAFALSMGLAAGYPMDAVITGKFRRSGLCSRVEGERLLAFTNTADPLFMFGAVAVGMFGLPEIGVPIAIAHYLAAFSVGFIYRFYGGKEEKTRERRRDTGTSRKIWKRAIQELYWTKQRDGRPLGQLLGDAVKESVGTLLMIGGFIMTFAVFITVMEQVGLVRVISPGVQSLLRFCGFDPDLGQSLLHGILEIDLGAMAVAQAHAPIDQRIILAGVIIGWSGLCVHGQVMSVVHDTDLRLAPYIIARVLHAVLAGLYTGLCLRILPAGTRVVTSGSFNFSGNAISRWYLSGRNLLIICGFLLACSLILRLLGKYRLIKVEEEGAPSTEVELRKSIT